MKSLCQDERLCCPICLDAFSASGTNAPYLLHCGHTFHKHCLTDQRTNTHCSVMCAVCRSVSQVPVSSLKPNFALIEVLSILDENTVTASNTNSSSFLAAYTPADMDSLFTREDLVAMASELKLVTLGDKQELIHRLLNSTKPNSQRRVEYVDPIIDTIASAVPKSKPETPSVTPSSQTKQGTALSLARNALMASWVVAALYGFRSLAQQWQKQEDNTL